MIVFKAEPLLIIVLSFVFICISKIGSGAVFKVKVVVLKSF